MTANPKLLAVFRADLLAKIAALAMIGLATAVSAERGCERLRSEILIKLTDDTPTQPLETRLNLPACRDGRLTIHLGGQPGAELEVPAVLVKEVRPDQRLFGLAAFYEQAFALLVSDRGELESTRYFEARSIQDDYWLALIGRYEAVAIRAKPVSLASWNGSHAAIELSAADTATVWVGTLGQSALALGTDLRYANLWKPLRVLARGFEWLLARLFQGVGSWGWSVVILALVVRIMLTPLYRWTRRLQSTVNALESQIQPAVTAIKTQFDGEAAHQKIMAVYKERGVTPFHTLKPLGATLLVIPFLIAIFNTLGAFEGLRGHSFLWIKDLAYPDSISVLPFAVPWLGNTLNGLPFLLLAVSLLAAATHPANKASATQHRRQQWNLVWMGVAFFILFYPFPSAMVLYWSVASLVPVALLVGNKLIKLEHANGKSRGG